MIEFCRQEDWEALTSLWEGFDLFHLEHSEYYFKLPTGDEREERHRKYLESPHALYLLFWQGNQPVGFLCAMVRSTPHVSLLRERSILEVHGLYVADGFRKRGIGTSLLKRAIQEGRERGVDDVEFHRWKWGEHFENHQKHLGFKLLSGKFGVSLEK